MTKTFRLCNSPRPYKIAKFPLLYNRSIRLAFQKLQRSLRKFRPALLFSDDIFKQMFRKKSRSLCLQMSKLLDESQDQNRQVIKNREMIRLADFRGEARHIHNNADSTEVSGNSGVARKVAMKKTDKSCKLRKKTKGPSLKRLSILEFKKNKKLADYFGSKHKELNEFLFSEKNYVNDPQKEISKSFCSESTMIGNGTSGLDTKFKSNKILKAEIQDIHAEYFNRNLIKEGISQSPSTNRFICSNNKIFTETSISSPAFSKLKKPKSQAGSSVKVHLKNPSLHPIKSTLNMSDPDLQEKNSKLLKVFVITRQQINSGRRRAGLGRDSKGLREMSRALIRLLSKNPNKQYSLDAICSQIFVEKRKIYDLINILTSIKMIKKVSKGIYGWLGPESIKSFMVSLPVFEDLTEIIKKEKSLGSMCYCFLSFIKTKNESSIESSAECLTPKPLPGKTGLTTISFRSKIRRLYDISKILATIGLIKNISENKKPLLRWVGTKNMLKVVNDISASKDDVDIVKNLGMKQILINFQKSLKTAILTVPEEEMKRKRLESIDLGIVEKYLNVHQGIILPSVNVVVPDI